MALSTDDGLKAVYDARTLGGRKMGILGLQHMFAMFGSTVLVPAITGLSVSATLLFAGIGTLLFHLITKFKVPAFLARPSPSSGDMLPWSRWGRLPV